MLMRGCAGRPTLCLLMISALKMPSCSRGSTGKWQGIQPMCLLSRGNEGALEYIYPVSSRYPLIIDPSGQATEFIMNEYKDRKITRTSFLDDAFRKNLESALRFGNPLLVQVCFLLKCLQHTFSYVLNQADRHWPLLVWGKLNIC